MQVVDNRKPTEEKLFADLPLGATYIDDYGCLCIKTTNSSEYYNCLMYDENKGTWSADRESQNNKVTICPTKLIIEG